MIPYKHTLPALALGLSFLMSTVLPAEARMMVDCTADAKLCPDGSYVSRTGPDCAFAPCPGESDGQTTSDMPIENPAPPAPPEENSTSKTSDPGSAFGWPDKDIEKVPTRTIDLDYLFAHRSALQGKTISLRGEIASTRFPGSTSCAYAQDACAGPNRITMQGDGKWENYKVLIFLKEDNDEEYEPGDTVTIRGRVSTGTNALTLREE